MAAIAERQKKRALHRKLSPAQQVEERYVDALVALTRDLHAKAMAWLGPRLHLATARTDAVTRLSSDFGKHIQPTIDALGPKIVGPFDAMQQALDAKTTSALDVLGVDLRHGPLGSSIESFRKWNVSLITRAGDAYRDDVRDILDDPATWGLRVEEIKEKLLERGNANDARAELIARDQTLKMNGAINRVRQTNAGVTRYTWSTSGDERVRDTHEKLDGQEYDWNDPPEIREDGERGHPGDDFQCRCVAVPVVPELDDEAEADDEAAAPDDTSSADETPAVAEPTPDDEAPDVAIPDIAIPDEGAIAPAVLAELPVDAPEDIATPKDAKRVAAGRKGAQALLERNSEIHDYVKSNLPPELHPLWEKEGRAFMKGLGSHAGMDRIEVKSLKLKGSTRYRQAIAERASSAFLEHVQVSSEGESDFGRHVFGLSEAKGEDAIAQHERELSERYQQEAIARGDMNERGELTEQGKERLAAANAEQEALGSDAAEQESQQESGGFFDDLLEPAADDLDEVPF